MNFGAAIFFTDYSMGPAELGRALEERGFESLWAPEHSHIPLSRRSPFPQGGDLPKKYYDVMDPFVTLAAAAGATTRLKVANGVGLVGAQQRHSVARCARCRGRALLCALHVGEPQAAGKYRHHDQRQQDGRQPAITTDRLLVRALLAKRVDPHVRAERRVAADTGVPAVGQHAQQPHLQVGGHVADLVQEQRAAFRLLEPAAP